jgi:hypothetical protein
MTTPKVYDGLRHQTEEIFYSILPWQSGAFYLVAPLDMTDVPTMLHLDTTGLLMDGVRLLDEKVLHSGEVDDEDDLRRLEPVSAHQLPADGLHVIVDTYSKALAGLFDEVGEQTAPTLRDSVRGFIQDSLPFQELFFGVDVGSDGSLSAKALIDNVAAELNDKSIRNMQLGLSEILFFALFAAGEEVTPELERKIEGQVATQLRELPHAGGRARRESGAPISPTDVSETSRVDLREFAAVADARAQEAKQIDDDLISEIYDDDDGEDTAISDPVQVMESAESDSAPIPMDDPVLRLDDDDEEGEARSENSVIAAIVDEEFSVELMEPGEDGVVVEPVGANHSEPVLLGKDSLLDNSFELSLDQDEEIMSLLDKVAEVQAEEAASRSQAGLLPAEPPPRSPSSEFDRLLSESDDEVPEDSPEPTADKSAQ